MTNKKLDDVDSVLGVCNRLPFSKKPHKSVAIFGNRNDGRRRAIALSILNNLWCAPFNESYCRIRCTQIYTYNLAHVIKLKVIMLKLISTYTSSPRPRKTCII